VSETKAEAPASAVIEKAQEKVGTGVEQAKSSAGSFIRSQVDERSTQLGEQLHGAVQALRQAEQTMEQEGTPSSSIGLPRRSSGRPVTYRSQTGGDC
jgi:vacuolar-type H+-ATPase subunit H